MSRANGKERAMKRWMVILMILVVQPNLLWADASTKLGRGITNTAFGWFEVINEVGNESDRQGPWIGFPSGLIRGAVYGMVRTVAGVYEIVTFPLPNGKKGYKPIVLPVTPWARR